MKPKTNYPDHDAFTRLELLALCAALLTFALIVFPALGRTHNNNSLTQSINNLRQLMNAWSMYPAQNGGRLVYSYPYYGANTNTWCRGSALSGGDKSSYSYYGSDATGIQTGDLWSYVLSLQPYKCPTDNRLATDITVPSPYKNQPILRSYSINAFMAGATFGTSSDTSVTSLNSPESNYRFFLRENQLSKPSGLFVFIEEDGTSINDGMLFMSMGTGGAKIYDLPARHHSNCYPLTFADGHAETYRLKEAASLNWAPGHTGGLSDWIALTNVTTVPSR
jgi:hypothetical protein